jgi:hypothetical protein
MGQERLARMLAPPANVPCVNLNRIPWRGRIDRAGFWQYWFYMATASQVQKNLQAAMRDALRIQDRFVAEPLFAKTGRGYLKSEGVATLQKIKSSLRRKSSAKAK